MGPALSDQSGSTAITGLVGSRISYSLSPVLHEREAQDQGFQVAYRLIDCDALGLTAADVPALIRHAGLLGYRGLNITYPYKTIAFETVSELSPLATAIRAVNTVVFSDGKLIGHNTDVQGFGAGLDLTLTAPDYRHVVQFGAGGAGAATAYALLERGVQRLSIVDLDDDRSQALVELLSPSFPSSIVESASVDRAFAKVQVAQGLVNATPVGSVNSPGSVLPAEIHHPARWVADIVYSPLVTRLLADARAAGAPTVDGGWMLVQQAARSFELFHGRIPDVARMRRSFARATRTREVV